MCRAPHERNAQPIFETADGPTDGWPCDAQILRGYTKTPRFSDSQENRNAIQIDCHWLDQVTSLVIIGQIVRSYSGA